MAVFKQLSLLLKKQGILKSRQPVILALQIIWPLLFLGGIVVLRQAIPPLQKNVCYYNARAMPSAGMLPFLQSFICNLDNECLEKDNYESIPTYKKAQLNQISSELSPLLKNEDLNKVIETLPKTEKLIKVFQKTVANPEVKKILTEGLKISDLLKDPEALKNYLTSDVKVMSYDVADALFDSNINIVKVMELFGKDDMKNVVCKQERLKLYLKVKDSSMLASVSKTLCSLDPELISILASKIQEDLNVPGLLKQVMRLVEGLGDLTLKNGLDDILSMLKVIENLDSLKNLSSFEFPKKILTDLLPSLLDLISSIRNGQLDLQFLKTLIQDITNLFDVSEETEAKMDDVKKIVTLIIDAIAKDKFIFSDSNVTLGSLFRTPEEVSRRFAKTSDKSAEYFLKLLSAKVKNDKLFYLQETNPVKILHALCNFPGISELFSTNLNINLTLAQHKFCSLHDGDALDLLKEDFSFIYQNDTSYGENQIYDHIMNIIDRYGKNVTDILEDLIPIPSSWSNAHWNLHKIDKILNIATLHYDEERSENSSPSTHSFSFLLELGEILLDTLASPVKVAKLMTQSDFMSVICTENSISSYLIIPDHINATMVSRILCKVYKDYQELVFEPGTNVNDISFRPIINKTFNFFHSLIYLNNHKSELKDQIDNTWRAWTDFCISPSATVILNVKFLEYLDTKLVHANSYTWHWVRSKLSAFHDFIFSLNSVFKTVIETSEIKLDAITMNVPLIQDLIHDSLQSIPDFINTTTAVFNGHLSNMLQRVHDIERFSFPCTYGFSYLLNFSHPEHVKRIENIICNNSIDLVPNVLKHPLISLLHTLIVVPENVTIPWSSLINQILEMDNNVKSLQRLKTSIFPDLVTLKNEIQVSMENMLQTFRFNSFQEEIRYILSNIVDQMLGWFYQRYDITVRDRENFTFAKAAKEFGPYRFYVLKFGLYSSEILLQNLSSVVNNLTNKEISVSEMFLSEPFQRVWKIIEKFSEEVDVIIPKLLEIDYTRYNNIQNVCSDKMEFELLFPTKNMSLDSEDLYFLFCELSSQIQKSSFPDEVYRSNSIPLMKTIRYLHDVWSNTSPERIDISTARIFDLWQMLQHNIDVFIHNPPKAESNIFNWKFWKILYQKLFHPNGGIQRNMVTSLIDKQLQFLYRHLTNGTKNGSFNTRIQESLRESDARGYAKAFMYATNYAFYALNATATEFITFLHDISGRDINLMKFLPSGSPFPHFKNIISNAVTIVEFLTSQCTHLERITKHLAMNNVSKICEDKELVVQLLNSTKLRSLIDDIHAVACMDVKVLLNMTLWSTSVENNPIVEIYKKLYDHWFNGTPQVMSLSSFKLVRTYENLVKTMQTIDPVNVTILNPLKSVFLPETWITFFNNYGKYQRNCYTEIGIQFVPSLIQLYHQLPASRKYFKIITAVFQSVDSLLLKYEDRKLNFTEAFDKSPEVSRFVRFIESNLPEILQVMVFTNRNISDPKYEKLIKENDALKVFCEKPYTYLINSSSSIDVYALHREFCSMNFSKMLSELKDEFDVNQNLNATDLDMTYFVQLIENTFYNASAANITFDSPLLNISRWKDLANQFNFQDVRSLNFIVKNISHLLEPLMRLFLNVSNSVPAVRPLVNLSHYFFLGFKDFLALKDKIISYKDGKIFHDTNDPVRPILQVLANSVNITRFGLYAFLYPNNLNLFVQKILDSKDPLTGFCNGSISWNHYFYIPDSLNTDVLDNLQDLICKYGNSEGLKTLLPINFAKYSNISRNLFNNNEADVDNVVSDISLLIDSIFDNTYNYTFVVLPTADSFTDMLMEFWDDFQQRFSLQNEKLPEILSEYLQGLKNVPKELKIGHYVRSITSVLEASTEILQGLKNGSVITQFSPLLKDHPQIQQFVKFIERNFVDIVRILTYSASNSLEKLMELGKSENLHLLCFNPEKFFTAPPNSNINVTTILSQYCSLNFTIDLGGVSQNTSDNQSIPTEEFIKELISFIENTIEVYPKLKMELPWMNASNWEVIAKDYGIEVDSAFKPVRLALWKLLPLIYNNTAIPRVNEMFISVNATVSIFHQILNQMVNTSYSWAMLRDLYDKRPQMKKILYLLNNAPDFIETFVLTAIEPSQLSLFLNDFLLYPNKTQFCSSKNISSYFTNVQKFDFHKLQELYCNFSKAKLLDDIFLMNVEAVYKYAEKQIQSGSLIDYDNFKENMEGFMTLLEQFSQNASNFEFRPDLRIFRPEVWKSMYRSLSYAIFPNVENFCHKLVDFVIMGLQYAPNRELWFAEPLSFSLKSLISVVKGIDAKNATIPVGNYRNLNKIYHIISKNPQDFFEAGFFLFSRLKLQMLPNVTEMLRDTCKNNATGYDKIFRLTNDTMFKMICNVVEDDIVTEFQQFLGVTKWLQSYRQRSYAENNIEELQATLHDVIDSALIVKNFFSKNFHLFSGPVYVTSYRNEYVLAPFVNYLVNITSTSTEMKYFWEISSSILFFSSDVSAIARIFYEPNQHTTFFMPNIISDEKKVIPINLSMLSILNESKIVLDGLFDARKAKSLIEDFLLSDKPIENFCNHKNLSRYFVDGDYAEIVPAYLDFCRKSNFTSIHDPLQEWVENLKRGIIGKVDAVGLVSSINHLIHLLPNFHGFDKALLAGVYNATKWRAMLKDHLVRPFMRTFLDRQNATEYLSVLEEPLNQVSHMEIPNHAIHTVLTVYSSLLHRFLPVNNTIVDIFKDARILGEVVRVSTDSELWQSVVNIAVNSTKISVIMEQLIASPCNVKLIYDLGVTASFSDSLANIQDILCHSPQELYDDVNRVFHIKLLQNVFQHGNGAYNRLGSNLLKMNSVVMQTEDYINKLSSDSYHWISRLSKLDSLNFELVNSYFAKMNTTGLISYMSSFENLLLHSIPADAQYTLKTAVNSLVRQYIFSFSFLQNYLETENYKLNKFHDKKFFVGMFQVYIEQLENSQVEVIMTDVNVLSRHPNLVKAKCSNPGFWVQIEDMIPVFCNLAPDQWMSQIDGYLKYKSVSFHHFLYKLDLMEKIPNFKLERAMLYSLNWTAISQLAVTAQKVTKKIYDEFDLKKIDFLRYYEVQLRALPEILRESRHLCRPLNFDLRYAEKDIALYHDAAAVIAQLLQKIPDLENYLCQLQFKNLTVAYYEFMDNLGMKDIFIKIRNLVWRQTNVTTVNCTEVTENLAVSVEEILRYVDSHDGKRWYQLDLCLNEIRKSPIITQIDEYLQLLSGLNKLNATKFNFSDALLKVRDNLQPIVDQFREIIVLNIDVFVETRDIYDSFKNKNSSPLWLHEIYDILYTEININLMKRLNFSVPAIRRVICNPLKVQTIIRTSRPWLKVNVSNLCSGDKYIEMFIDFIESSDIIANLQHLQRDQLAKFDWLSKLLANIGGIMKNTGELSKLGITFTELQKNFANMSISSLAKSVVTLLNQRQLSNIILHVQSLIEELRPIIPSSQIVDDVQTILTGLRGLKVITGSVFGDMKYQIKNLIVNVDAMKSFLVDEIKMESTVVDAIMNSSLHISAIFNSKKPLSRDSLCNPEELSSFFNITSDAVSITEISQSLCQISLSKFMTVLERIIKDIDLTTIVKKYMELNINRILSEADVTENEINDIAKGLKSLKGIIPELKMRMENITDILKSNSELIKLNVTIANLNDLPVSEALRGAGSVMCGNPLEVLKDKLVLIDGGDGKSVNIKESELKSLPTEYCQNLYRQIINLSGGPVIWGFLKPIMQGRVLYTPDTPITREIIHGANSTFRTIGEFSVLLKRWAKGVKSLNYFTNSESSMHDLELVLKSDIFQGIIHQVFKSSDNNGGDYFDILSLFNTTNLIGDLGNAEAMSRLVILTSNITECFNADRFHGYNSEEEIIRATREFGAKGQFLASIVFLNMDDDDGGGDSRQRDKRDANGNVPSNIQYKIRMDIDSVQYTTYLKDIYWRPKAHDNFATDLRYQHGFIQLQDMIDRAIINMHSDKIDSNVLPQVFGQQFPNPCFNKDEFGYYLKGMLPVIMTMAWLFMVAFLIREKILEQELQLEQVMRVMGLSSWTSFLSWFLLNFLIMVFVVIIMVIMVKLGQIITFSDWSVLLIFLLDFSFAVLMFCYCMSTLFNKATIGALTGLILYLMFYLPFVIMLALEASLALSSKLSTSLLMSSAFSFGCLYLARFEELGTGIQWSNIWDSPLPNDQMNFAYALIMLAVDGLLYGLIGWYVSNVFPAQEGVQRKKFYFFLLPSYWGCSRRNRHYVIRDATQPFAAEIGSDMQNVQELDDYNGSSLGIALSNLWVVYNHGKKSQKVAVKAFSLDFYENQITTLLGQNGAGKTTTINVLTGQTLPTNGMAYVGGLDVTSEFKKARKTIGYCPQYNILFDNMTIREHLLFYGKLKGLMSTSKLQADINSMISSMGLDRLQNELVKNVSSGMKRRLCVALAFVGGSTTIILDEPTSGVDPLARRSIWDLILKNKQGRTILLTTHHMDEADVLSDRVAVMHEGSLLCCGMSMYLKSKYGSGYLLSVETSNTSILDEKISNSASPNYNYSNRSTAEILSFLQKFVPGSKITESYSNHSTFAIPYLHESGQKIELKELFTELERSYEHLGIITYNLSCTTLEEVFLKLCARADSGYALNLASPSPKSSISSHSSDDGVIPGKNDITDVSDLINEDPWMTDTTFRFSKHQPMSHITLKLQQFSALIYKRFWHHLRDWRTIFCGIILPCVFIASAMGFSLIRPQSGKNPSRMLTPSMYGPHASSFISTKTSLSDKMNTAMKNIYSPPGVGSLCLLPQSSRNGLPCVNAENNFTANYLGSQNTKSKQRTCKCVDNFPIQKCEGDYLGFEPSRYVSNTTDVIYDVSGHEINDYLLLSYQDFRESRYGGWSADDEDAVKIWYNSNGFHSLPAYFNALSNAFLRSVAPDPSNYGITTYNHPIHVTSDQLIRETIAQRVAEIGISLIFLIGFCFIPSGFVIYLVKERMSEEKRLQYISGVGPILYWMTAYVWDTLVIAFAVVLSTIIILIFNIPIYTAQLNLPATILLLFMFCWSTTPLMYILEKLFRDGSIAAMVLYCFNCFISVNTLMCILILTLFKSMENINTSLQIIDKIFLIFPHYALGSGLLEISRNQIKTEIYRKFGHEAYENPFNFLYDNFLVMLLQGILFFLINLFIESKFVCCSNRRNARDSGMPIFDPEDTDVQAERKRVNGNDQSDILKMINLTKVYRGVLGRNIAVDKLCLGLKRGECFGLLGVNGAGKTTTFRMLTGDINPTWGQVMVKNKIISEVISKGSQLIGYCPQADALDDYLTCKEVLKTYAKLRGVRNQNLDLVIHRMLTKYNLKHYADCLTSRLSGGTKRKLCTAVASLGNPEIILMDEPTSGMDPKTRRLVWNNILSMIKDQRSVLLTSHSMEECDILCTKLAIMVNGKLKCLGSPQYLKNKFGDGFLVTLRLKQRNPDWGNVIRFFNQNFPLSSLKAHNHNIVQFSVPSQDSGLGLIFHHLESECDKLHIQDFSVTQTSLDQVFVNFARNQSDGILDEDEIPIDFGQIDSADPGHANAAYNKIYGLPDSLSDDPPNASVVTLSKSPNMYYGDESSTDVDFTITKL